MTHPDPYDAWALSQQLTGATLNGELAAVSAPFRPIADRLNDTPAKQRQALWQAFLCSPGIDRDRTIRAVDDADPDGPAPAPGQDEDDEGGDWEPIRYATLPDVESFPLDVLPPPARRFAEAVARSIDCPADFPASIALAAASIAIGQSCSLRIKSGYEQSAGLYLAVVGGASSGKSPALRLVATSPLGRISRRLQVEHAQAVERWSQMPPDQRGKEPRRSRVFSTEPTVESFGPILMSNPRGLSVIYDEMTKWVNSMDQYKNGKGGDRQFYLSAWSGTHAAIDRVQQNQVPIEIERPFVSIVGGLVPAMLPSLAEGMGQEDGFMARLLFVFPDRHLKGDYSEEGIDPELTGDWGAMLDALHARPMRVDDHDGPAPRVVEFTGQARADWKAWMDAHNAEIRADDFPDRLEAAWGKLDAYAARLALVLHLMDLATDPELPAAGDVPPLPRAILQAAFRLVAYFKGQARRIYAAIGGTDDLGVGDVKAHARAVIKWIKRRELTSFTQRDAQRGIGMFKSDLAGLIKALDWLCSRNILKAEPPPERPPGKAGRSRNSTYTVSPELINDPRFCR